MYVDNYDFADAPKRLKMSIKMLESIQQDQLALQTQTPLYSIGHYEISRSIRQWIYDYSLCATQIGSMCVNLSSEQDVL